jgi:ketosteroid isomerase-like protein
MVPKQDIHRQVEQVLARFSDLVSRRDLEVVDEFTDDAVLVGSEPGEIASGAIEVLAFFQAFFAQAVRVHWRWDVVRAACVRDVAWFFAEGEACADGPAGERARAAYRLSGVLRWNGQRWLWQQFHGAEPRAAQA